MDNGIKELTAADIKALTKGWTPKMLKFCHEYCVDLNGKQAAIRAGYAAGTNGNSAIVQASRLLSNAKVSEYIAHLKRNQMQNAGVTAERIVKELAKIAFSSPTDIAEYQDGNFTLKALVDMNNPQSIKTIKVKEVKDQEGNKVGDMTEVVMHDKLKALELLGRHTAIFTDNVNLTNNGKDLPVPKQVTNITINHRKATEAIEKQKK